MSTILEVETDALREIGVLNAVDPAGGELAALALLRLNKILDNLNADRQAVYADVLEQFTLTGVQPETLGPTGATLTTTQRPVSIEGAAVVDGDYRYPITHDRDRDWWLTTGQNIGSGTQPTDLYYETAWPNGKLYFAPAPSAGVIVELARRVVLASVAAADTFSFPPGYQDYLTMLLAVDLAAPLRVPVAPETRDKLQKAEARIVANNVRIPKIQTRQAGMPGGGGGFWDYQTGRIR